MQSSTSTDSPTHVPMPLHPRALILDPVPHVTEHWAHSLQSCHMLSIPQSKCKQILPPLENFVPAQTSKLQLRVSVLSPGQVSSPPGSAWRHARALNWKPGPQVAVHGDHSPQSCHSVTISRKEKVKQWCFVIRLPGQSGSSQSLACVDSPKHSFFWSRQVRVLIVRLSPQDALQTVHAPHWSHSP